jgi:hypothetical protein
MIYHMAVSIEGEGMSDIDQQRAETLGQAIDLLNDAKDAGRLPGLWLIMLLPGGGYKSIWWTDEAAQTASLIGTANVDIIRMVGRLVDNVEVNETP